MKEFLGCLGVLIALALVWLLIKVIAMTGASGFAGIVYALDAGAQALRMPPGVGWFVLCSGFGVLVCGWIALWKISPGLPTLDGNRIHRRVRLFKIGSGCLVAGASVLLWLGLGPAPAAVESLPPAPYIPVKPAPKATPKRGKGAKPRSAPTPTVLPSSAPIPTLQDPLAKPQ